MVEQKTGNMAKNLRVDLELQNLISVPIPAQNGQVEEKPGEVVKGRRERKGVFPFHSSSDGPDQKYSWILTQESEPGQQTSPFDYNLYCLRV